MELVEDGTNLELIHVLRIASYFDVALTGAR